MVESSSSMLAVQGKSKCSLYQLSNADAPTNAPDIGSGSDTACSRGPTGRFRGRLGAPWASASASDKRRLRLSAGVTRVLDVDASLERGSSKSSWKDDAGEGNPEKGGGVTSSLNGREEGQNKKNSKHSIPKAFVWPVDAAIHRI